MKRRLLDALTALCLCLALLPTAALAQDGPEWPNADGQRQRFCHQD